MKKILTISIAAYNVEEYLPKTLQSCIVSPELQQFLEVLIVNDGSSDGTLKIAQNYEKQYPEIFHVINKKNGGYGSTINAALKVATGKYFRILDGDDWVDTSVLEKLLQQLQECNEDVVFTNAVHVLEDNGKHRKKRIVEYGNEQLNKTLNLKQECSLTWKMHHMTVRTDLLKDNNVSIIENCFYTDGEFVFYVIAYMKTFRCLDYIFYQYRLGRVGQSVSRQGRIKHKEDYYKVLKQELAWLEAHDVSDVVKKDLLMRHITNTATGVIEYYLLCPCNRAGRNTVKKIDFEIKERNEEVYNRMFKKKAIWILRFFHYYSYRVCQWNEFRKMQSMNNM